MLQSVLRNPHLAFVQQGEPANTSSKCSKDQHPYLQQSCFQQEKKHTDGHYSQAKKWSCFRNKKIWRNQSSLTACSSKHPGRINGRCWREQLYISRTPSQPSLIIYHLHSCFKVLVWNQKDSAIRWLMNKKLVSTAELPRWEAWA